MSSNVNTQMHFRVQMSHIKDYILQNIYIFIHLSTHSTDPETCFTVHIQ